jgi:hypothetical protein
VRGGVANLLFVIPKDKDSGGLPKLTIKSYRLFRTSRVEVGSAFTSLFTSGLGLGLSLTVTSHHNHNTLIFCFVGIRQKAVRSFLGNSTLLAFAATTTNTTPSSYINLRFLSAKMVSHT